MPSLKSRISQPCVSSAYRALYPGAVGLFRPSGPIIPLSATKTKLSKVHESTGPANRLRTGEGTLPASTGFHECQAQHPAGHPVSRFGDSQRVTTVYNKDRSLGEPMVCGIRSGLYYLRCPNYQQSHEILWKKQSRGGSSQRHPIDCSPQWEICSTATLAHSTLHFGD